jgi:hypothetical protein
MAIGRTSALNGLMSKLSARTYSATPTRSSATLADQISAAASSNKPVAMALPADKMRHVDNEIARGVIDGVNATFYLDTEPLFGSLHLYLQGDRQLPGVDLDYTASGSVITFDTPPRRGSGPLLADYRVLDE